MSPRTAFDRDGWYVWRSVIESDELASLNELFASIVPSDGDIPMGRDGRLAEVTGAACANAPLKRTVRDRRFGALVAAVLGASRVQLLQDSLLTKPARDGGVVAWHQDHTYVGFLMPPRVVSLRIALRAETEASGCLRVVSGSQRWGPVGPVQALTQSRVDSLIRALAPGQRDALASAIPLVLNPGDVSVHHCLTLHGSGPNRSAEPRRTIILRMFDGDVRLDTSRLPSSARSYFPTDASGALAVSAFPLVFG
jgi:ectoine hydroxylase-related dioxygenase (phytanoyl-CoA dioxygenase family)